MIAAIAAAAVLLRSVVFFIVVLPFLLILSLFSFVSSVLFYFSFIISDAGSLLSFYVCVDLLSSGVLLSSFFYPHIS